MVLVGIVAYSDRLAYKALAVLLFAGKTGASRNEIGPFFKTLSISINAMIENMTYKVNPNLSTS
jgi:hypothetical protein